MRRPDNWAKAGDRFVLADKLAVDVLRQARVTAFKKLQRGHGRDLLAMLVCSASAQEVAAATTSPCRCSPAITSPTTPAPASCTPRPATAARTSTSGRRTRASSQRAASTRTIPYTVDDDGRFTEQAPGFAGKRVLTDKGEKGDANEAVIKALIDAGMLIARGRLKHQYPHSWRSKKPVIFRNTPQWFIAMDKDIAERRKRRHAAPARARRRSRRRAGCRPQGENRITGMIESRPDWVISRQRAWGVPIAVFVREKGDGSVEILHDESVNARIVEAFEQEGADAWYAQGARERFLGSRANEDWQKVDDILDVWFDSGSTHAFVLEDPKHFPALAGIKRKADGGADTVMYLEGSDQHRGWFQSSLLESCGTRGRAPFDVVLTHGFMLDEHGRKMSKSLGNVDRAAGRDQAVRRRHPAHVGVRRRLCRRSAHRPGNPQDHRRDLSQAAQHDALDARQSRAFPRPPIASRSRKCRSSSG